MPPACAVRGCRSHCIKGRVSLHKLPHEAGRREEYLRRQPNLNTALKNPLICSLHFDRNAFENSALELPDNTKKFRAHLKPDAVPHDESIKDHSKRRQTQNVQFCQPEDDDVGGIPTAQTSISSLLEASMYPWKDVELNISEPRICTPTAEDIEQTIPSVVEDLTNCNEYYPDEMLPTPVKMMNMMLEEEGGKILSGEEGTWQVFFDTTDNIDEGHRATVTAGHTHVIDTNAPCGQSNQELPEEIVSFVLEYKKKTR